MSSQISHPAPISETEKAFVKALAAAKKTAQESLFDADVDAKTAKD
jgi:hypothetical protein